MSIDYASLLSICATVAATLTFLLAAKSILSFTQTGPEIRDEIRKHVEICRERKRVRLAEIE